MKNLITFVQVAAGQFTDHIRMTQNLVILKQRPEALVPSPQVINPYGGVNQDHALPERRRRTGCRPFSVPPSSARRRADCLAINASSPNRTSAVFLFQAGELGSLMKKTVINVQCCSHMRMIMPPSYISVKIHGGIVLERTRPHRPEARHR